MLTSWNTPCTGTCCLRMVSTAPGLMLASLSAKDCSSLVLSSSSAVSWYEYAKLPSTLIATIGTWLRIAVYVSSRHHGRASTFEVCSSTKTSLRATIRSSSRRSMRSSLSKNTGASSSFESLSFICLASPAASAL
jgi:hypothetical protein